MKRMWGSILSAVLLGTGVASAQSDELRTARGQGWSTLSGDTVGSGNNVFSAQIGWPGISLSLLHGVGSNFDFGGKFSFNYGEEGIVTSTVPGVKIQAVMRLKLLQSNKLNFGIDFEPGPLFYFFGNRFCDRFGCYYPGETEVGLALPIDFNFGIAVGSAFMTNFGVWVPMWVTFGPSGGLVLPVLVGGGFEYFIDSKLALSFNLHLGPAIDTYGGYAYLQLDAMFGVHLRF